MTQAELHYRKMTQTPVERLIVSLSVPTIISMLISNIYNLADTYFVGSLGVSASGAVGVVFTLMTVLQAIGFMLGHGAGSVISRLLAKQDADAASHYASTSFFLAIGVGALFLLLGIPLIDPLMRAMGSTDTILPYARNYGVYILAAAPMLIASLVLNNVLRYEGMAFYAMIGLSLGAILNMIGDPIFIYGLHMGVSGAGLSTALSQTLSFIVLLVLFQRHAQSRLSPRNFSANLHTIWDILSTGFPNLFRQGLMSVSSGVLNHCAGVYGDACVSAMAITARCQSFMLGIAIGVCQGFQPVAGFNYQAQKYARLRRAFRFTFLATVAILAALGCVGLIFAPQIVTRFQSDNEVLRIGSRALRLVSLGLVFSALNLSPSMLFQTCGLKGWALLLATLRGGLCFIPLLLILAPLLGVTGLQLAQPCADVLTGLISLPFALRFFRDLPRTDLRTAADGIAAR